MTDLPFIQNWFGNKKDTARMAKALLASYVTPEDLNEYTHMAIEAIDKFSQLNNFPK